MNDTLKIFVRRYDGAWRVFAVPSPNRRRRSRLIEGPAVHFDHSDDERPFEHVHRDAFRDFEEAQAFAREIRYGLRQGRDLNLQFWKYLG